MRGEVEAEAPLQKLEELLARQQGIAHVDAAGVLAPLSVERGMDERRFARSRFADQHRDALTAGDRVLDVAQRFPMLVGQEQIARVRRQVERPLSESVETFVHQRATTFQTSAAADTTTAAAAVLSTSLRFRLRWRCSAAVTILGIMASTGS